jgi:hypothetical protein
VEDFWKATSSVRYLFYNFHTRSKEVKNYLNPGVYSGIFAMHVQYHASKKETNNAKQNIIFYALCVLYVLSGPVIALDIATIVVSIVTSIFLTSR